MTNYLLLALKGCAMGMADVIPGVSGGTIAFISGIYTELIESIKKLGGPSLRLLATLRLREFWREINGNFLAAVFVGILVAVFSLARAMTYLLEHHPIEIWAFFFGLIVASALLVARDVTRWNAASVVSLLCGIAAAWWITVASPSQTPETWWFILLSGAIAICAMILPGISGAFILLLMGKYQFILNAVSSFDIGILALFATGAVAGLVSFSHVLSWLLRRYHDVTISLLIGLHGRIAQQGVAVERDARKLFRQSRRGASARRTQRAACNLYGIDRYGGAGGMGCGALRLRIPAHLGYRVRRQSYRRQKGRSMKRYGLIGRPLGHSFSAGYFAAKFRREGITGCDYALYELPSIEALPELLGAQPELQGFNVTIPYKQRIFDYLDDVSEEAARIGAVNCVRRDGGRLTGFNTDIEGVRLSLRLLLGDDLPEAALVLGTGGASQAVQYALAEAEIPYAVVSRDPARGNFLYDDLRPEVVAGHRLIVNATPVGTFPHVDEAPLLPYEALTAAHYLFDLVYNPERTQFLLRGERQGAHTLNGLPMLEAQAEASWRIWNGVI